MSSTTAFASSVETGTLDLSPQCEVKRQAESLKNEQHQAETEPANSHGRNTETCWQFHAIKMLYERERRGILQTVKESFLKVRVR